MGMVILTSSFSLLRQKNITKADCTKRAGYAFNENEPIALSLSFSQTPPQKKHGALVGNT